MKFLKRSKKFISKIVLASTLLFGDAHAQELANGTRIKPEARVAVYGVNVLGNGLICGTVAAVKNRKIIKDTIKCMFAGNIQYLGMELGMKNVPVLPGFALRITETGTSMIDNTIKGRGILDNLQYEFNTFIFDINTKKRNLGLYWRIIPIIGTVKNISEENTFSIEDTLSYQTTAFYRSPQVGEFGGNSIGNIILYERTRNLEVSESSSRYRAHEFAHVMQYIRVRPMQNGIPNILGFLEDKLHLRVGEDIGLIAASTPRYACEVFGEKDCGIQPYNIMELEAYAMDTAH